MPSKKTEVKKTEVENTEVEMEETKVEETEVKKVEPQAPKMKSYSEMTKQEMIDSGVYIDVIEDHFPEQEK